MMNRQTRRVILSSIVAAGILTPMQASNALFIPSAPAIIKPLGFWKPHEEKLKLAMPLTLGILASSMVPPIGGIDTFTKLMMHMDGTNGSTVFTDSSLAPRTMTRIGQAQISTAQSKFSGASGLFDGAGDGISSPASIDWLLNGDFTIDFWWRPTANNARQMFVDDGQLSGIFEATGSTGNVTVYIGGGGSTAINGGATPFTLNTWVHLALVKSGTSWTVYRNGAVYLTGTNVAVFGQSTATCYFCDYASSGYSINGYIDEFRISKGIARWTAPFTPNDGPYTT